MPSAKLFLNGRSQAVRLPRVCRFEGDRVHGRRVGNTVDLEPARRDLREWFARMDEFGDEPFMEDGRDQPAMPDRDIDFD
jgi:antitoxin VapB